MRVLCPKCGCDFQPERSGKQITESKVLLVEGQDEVNLCSSMLKELEIGGVQVIDAAGGKKLATEFALLVKDKHFPRVTAFAILRDAEKNCEHAFQSVRDTLRKHGQPCPPKPCTWHVGEDGRKVGVYINPDGKSEGMIEDLCLSSVEQRPAMRCVTDYLKCLRASLSPEDAANLGQKAEMLAFLASLGGDVRSIGVAAQRGGIWDFAHAAFGRLREFLRELDS